MPNPRRLSAIAAAGFFAAGWARADSDLPATYYLAPAETAPREESGDPLDQPVSSFRAAQLPIAAAFLSVSRSYGITFVLDPALKGEVTLEARGGTVRDLVDALARSQGYYWQREGRLIAVRKNVLRFYEIDYPQMTRSAQGSSSVVLSAQAGAGGGVSPPAATPSGERPSNQNDQTNLSIQQQNQTTFWTDVQAELSAMAQPGETAAINKLAGIAVINAPPGRQEDFKAFLAVLNRRISQQVRICARVLEVNLDSQHQLGVDWSLAATRIGGLALTNAGVVTNFTAIDGRSFVPSTITGTVGTGKIAAVITALHEQGEIRAVSNPSVVSLSNQTAFVKVGTEQTFFSLANSTTINPSATTVPYATTQSSYTQNAITIGTVLYVTPEVNGDGTVTVDVLPAITQLIGVDTSPDGHQTAPRMDIKALSTIARLREGESILIGGLIYDESRKESRDVPGLRKLPVLGPLFATSGRATLRSELVIFLSAERVKHDGD